MFEVHVVNGYIERYKTKGRQILDFAYVYILSILSQYRAGRDVQLNRLHNILICKTFITNSALKE